MSDLEMETVKEQPAVEHTPAPEAPKKEVKLRRNGKPKKTLGQEILEWVITLAVALVVAFVVRSFLFEPVKVDGNSMYPTLRHGEIMYVSKTSYGTGFLGIPFTNIGWRFNVGGEPERMDVVVCYYADEDKNVVKRLVGLPGDTVELRKNPTATRMDQGNNPYRDKTNVYDLYINGVLMDEDFIYHEARSAFGPFIVPKKGDLVNPQTRSAYSAEELATLNIVVYKETYTNADGDILDREFSDRDGNPIAASDVPADAVFATRCEEDQYFLMGDNRTNSLDSRTNRTVARGDIVGKVESVIWHSIPNDLSDSYQYNDH